MHPLKERIEKLVRQQNQNAFALETALNDARQLAQSPDVFKREFGHDSWESYQNAEVSLLLHSSELQINVDVSDSESHRRPRVVMHDAVTGLPFHAEVNEDGY